MSVGRAGAHRVDPDVLADVVAGCDLGQRVRIWAISCSRSRAHLGGRSVPVGVLSEELIAVHGQDPEPGEDTDLGPGGLDRHAKVRAVRPDPDRPRPGRGQRVDDHDTGGRLRQGQQQWR